MSDTKRCPHCHAPYTTGSRIGHRWSMAYACGYLRGGVDGGSLYVITACPTTTTQPSAN
jgi:hypothetical protein